MAFFGWLNVFPSRRRYRPLLTLQTLESRVLPAGVVKVTVNGDDVAIKGDGNDNNIEIVNRSGVVTVESSDTMIEGGDTGVAVMDLNNLVIVTKGGSDSVFFPDGGLDVGGNFVVNMGGGSFDYLGMDGTDSPLTVRGNSNIKMGGGGNMVQLFETTFEGSVSIRTGNSLDLIEVFPDTVFQGPVLVKSGGGDDSLFAFGAEFQDTVSINTGGGNDSLLLGPDSGDSSPLVLQDDLFVKMGGGNDRLDFDEDTDYSGVLNFNGGGGNDLMTPDPDAFDMMAGVTVSKFEGLWIT